MPTFAIDVRASLRGLTRDLDDFKRRQVPFAAAQALTAVARKVAAAESDELAKTFDRPTPFTLKAFAVRGARKQNLTATVFAKDIQADYLEPYLDGGTQALGSKQVILTPIQVALNAYGNIPKGKIAALKGRPGIFVGTIRGVGGVWQRIEPPRAGPHHKGHVQPKAHLKLLIEFKAPKPVTKHLDYRAKAAAVVNAELPAAFEKAMAQALATAR